MTFPQKPIRNTEIKICQSRNLGHSRLKACTGAAVPIGGGLRSWAYWAEGALGFPSFPLEVCELRLAMAAGASLYKLEERIGILIISRICSFGAASTEGLWKRGFRCAHCHFVLGKELLCELHDSLL